MSLAAKQAWSCWIVALGLIIGALFAFIGPPASADGASEAIGRVLALTGIAALLCWYVARRAEQPWSWGRFIISYIGLIIVLAVVAAAGRAHV